LSFGQFLQREYEFSQLKRSAMIYHRKTKVLHSGFKWLNFYQRELKKALPRFGVEGLP
jgi:hypothetical protein